MSRRDHQQQEQRRRKPQQDQANWANTSAPLPGRLVDLHGGLLPDSLGAIDDAGAPAGSAGLFPNVWRPATRVKAAMLPTGVGG
jgi:hypothetical protein